MWRLDRLGRRMRHFIDTVNALYAQGIEFCSVRENIDTRTASGRVVLQVFATLAEFERELVRERTAAGLAAIAPAGTAAAAMTPEKIAVARQIYASQAYTIDQIAKTIGVTRDTIYQHLDVTAA